MLTDNLAFVNAGSAVHAIDLLTRQSVWSVPLTGELALANDVLVISNPQGVSAFLVPEPSAQVLAVSALCVWGMLVGRRCYARKK